jgi:hypothetical protein
MCKYIDEASELALDVLAPLGVASLLGVRFFLGVGVSISSSVDLVLCRFFATLSDPGDDFDFLFGVFDGEFVVQNSSLFGLRSCFVSRRCEEMLVNGACLRLSGLGRAHSAPFRASIACSTVVDVAGRLGVECTMTSSDSREL